jgi:methionyl-tRNA formyltransferase
VIAVAAYGQILRPEVLDLPPYGCLNVHASLLPRWRGAAPINAAILRGDPRTGVTIMRMDAGMDTGPILSQRVIPIEEDDTAGTLSDKLSRIGAELLVETLPAYLRGEISPQAQDDSQATFAPLLKKEDGEMDFSQSASFLARQVRAHHPWPGAFTIWNDLPLKIHQASAVEQPSLGSVTILPGKRTVYRGLPAIGAADGLLLLEQVQPAGKRSMSGKDFLQGARDWS